MLTYWLKTSRYNFSHKHWNVSHADVLAENIKVQFSHKHWNVSHVDVLAENIKVQSSLLTVTDRQKMALSFSRSKYPINMPIFILTDKYL